jgi:hypothetical protein
MLLPQPRQVRRVEREAHQSMRPWRRLALQPPAKGGPVVGVCLSTFVSELRQAFFVFGISRLQTIRLAFGGVLRGRIRLGLRFYFG